MGDEVNMSSAKQINPADYTVKQLLIAAGLSRRMKVSHICIWVGCEMSYVSNLTKKENFTDLVERFSRLVYSDELKQLNGVEILYGMVIEFLQVVAKGNN